MKKILKFAFLVAAYNFQTVANPEIVATNLIRPDAETSKANEAARLIVIFKTLTKPNATEEGSPLIQVAEPCITEEEGSPIKATTAELRQSNFSLAVFIFSLEANKKYNFQRTKYDIKPISNGVKLITADISTQGNTDKQEICTFKFSNFEQEPEYILNTIINTVQNARLSNPTSPKIFLDLTEFPTNPLLSATVYLYKWIISAFLYGRILSHTNQYLCSTLTFNTEKCSYMIPGQSLSMLLPQKSILLHCLKTNAPKSSQNRVFLLAISPMRELEAEYKTKLNNLHTANKSITIKIAGKKGTATESSFLIDLAKTAIEQKLKKTYVISQDDTFFTYKVRMIITQNNEKSEIVFINFYKGDIENESNSTRKHVNISGDITDTENKLKITFKIEVNTYNELLSSMPKINIDRDSAKKCLT